MIICIDYFLLYPGCVCMSSTVLGAVQFNLELIHLVSFSIYVFIYLGSSNFTVMDYASFFLPHFNILS